jgi:hypothetical protein
MATILKQRRDTAANWALSNPVIPDGQLCFDTTNNTFRIGDGTTNYNSLSIQSGTAGADGADGTGTGGSIEAIADGVLANGDKVILQSDGTVKIISETTTNNPASVGSEVTINPSSFVNGAKPVFDSNSNKIVIAYQQQDLSTPSGAAVVGTVTGTSISFGTPVVFSSSSVAEIEATFDSNANKVVIAYSEASTGKAIVGTVSGTSISFGTAATWISTNGTNWKDITFDSNSNKVVIAFSDTSLSNYGRAIVGTVSGTSISFGAINSFANVDTAAIALTFDSNLNKVVISYTDVTNIYYGKVIVGTVSGTSISFGSVVFFNSFVTTDIATTFDSNSNKVVTAFKDGGMNNYGSAIVGTVSGTSISFGTKVAFDTIASLYIAITFDSISNDVIISYAKNGGDGKVIVGTVSGTSISYGSEIEFNSGISRHGKSGFDSNANKVVIAWTDSSPTHSKVIVYENTSITITTNLTTDNFIGISNGVYADTATATIQVVGSTDDAQSGLTTGSKYYVQGDGTVNTTPGVPSVYAGMSLSTTKLLIKG